MLSLFKDKNDINEKNLVGFISFIVMVCFAVADLLTPKNIIFKESRLPKGYKSRGNDCAYRK